MEPGKRFSCQKLASDLLAKGIAARAYPGTDELLEALASELMPGDLCLVMSNGGFEGLHVRLLHSLGGGPAGGREY